MDNLDFDAVARRLSLIASDPPSLESFRLSNPSFVALCRLIGEDATADNTPKPFPAIEEMNAIQAAIFDNWPNGKRVLNHPNRYGMAIEVWTEPADRINVAKRKSYQHKGNVRLMDAKELGKRIDGLQSPKLRNPISAAYAATIKEIQGQMRPGDYVGLIATKTPEEGTFYHDMQLVFVTLDGEESRCLLMVGAGEILLPRFSRHQPNGEPLTGASVILQSRFDRCRFSSTWATEAFDE